MKPLKFRLLNADEIDCRVATVTANGVSLLLYKDARVDQNILDETVGPMGWQRRHCRENANCIVSIWDDEKGQCTEKEKGLASDSFKRACFNWGIGRELYTAPSIWVSNNDCEIYENGDRNGSRKKYGCNDRFYVSKIGYDANRNINMLEVKRRKNNRVVYKLGQHDVHPEEPRADLVTEAHINTLFLELARTGIGRKSMLSKYGLKDIHDMTMKQFREAMDILKSKPDKPTAPDPATVPPDDPEEGLPWNEAGR